MTAAQIYKIQLAFGNLGWELSPKGSLAIHKKYSFRIQKAMLGFAKDARGRWPTLGITDTIKELILRGWVHKAEATNIKPTEYSVYCHYADLVYNKSWDSQDGALKFLIQGGIPGRTGVRSPYKR